MISALRIHGFLNAIVVACSLQQHSRIHVNRHVRSLLHASDFNSNHKTFKSLVSSLHISQVSGDDIDTASQPKKHCVRWTTSKETVEFGASDGELLRTAALRRGLVSPHNGKATLINCRGLGTCGTCAVEVLPASTGNSSSANTNSKLMSQKETDVPWEPKERNNRERIRLSLPPHNPEKQSPFLRLACQVQVRGDLIVTKRSGFWGQHESLSPSNTCKTYLGDWEYILDARSPADGNDEIAKNG